MTPADRELDAAYAQLSQALAIYREAQARFERAMCAVQDQYADDPTEALRASARRLAGPGDDDRPVGAG